MQKTLLLVLVVASMGAALADAPALPVKATMRESALIKGTFVDQFRNEGDTSLVLHVAISRADGSEMKHFMLIVPANGVKEIGKLQGWVGKSGDQIKIESQGFAEMDVQIP